MKKIFYSIALIILAVSFYSFNSIAATANTNQTTAISKADNSTAAEVDYRDINKQLTNIEKDLLNTKAPINSVTSDYIKTLNDMQDRVNTARQQAETNLGFVQKRNPAVQQRLSRQYRHNIRNSDRQHIDCCRQISACEHH